MLALSIKGFFHWGFSVRLPYTSAGGKSYQIPPPSTIVGALSKPYCREKGVTTLRSSRGEYYSCTWDFLEKYGKHIREIAATVEISAPYEGLLRQFRAPYRQSKYRKITRVEPKKGKKGSSENETEESERVVVDNRREWFGVSAFGFTFSRNFTLVILLDEGKYAEDLRRYALQITAIGSKESVVTIENVEVKNKIKPITKAVKTRFYFPKECAKQYNPNDFELVQFVDIIRLHTNQEFYTLKDTFNSYNDLLTDYLVPKYGSKGEVEEVKDGCLAYSIDGEGVIIARS